MSIPTSMNEEGETERVSDFRRVPQSVNVRTEIQIQRVMSGDSVP